MVRRQVLRGHWAGRTVTNVIDHVSERAAVREMLAAGFEDAVRRVGDVEAKRLLLEVLRDKRPRPPVVVATPEPVTSTPSQTGTTSNALTYLAKTGRLPDGDPPWRLDGGGEADDSVAPLAE